MWETRLVPVIFVLISVQASCVIKILPSELSMKLYEVSQFSLKVSNLNDSVDVNFKVQHEDILQLLFNETVQLNLQGTYGLDQFKVLATNLGRSAIEISTSHPSIGIENELIKVEVYNWHLLTIISLCIGWTYFLVWSISFYPQISINYKRKSVTGLNFDFLSFNIVGFTCDNIFNLGLYYMPYLQDEYFRRYTRGLIPVLINDIFFSIHAFVATSFTIFQCFLYEKGSQRVSTTARCILTLFAICILTTAILCSMNILHWLDFIYCCSYVKLIVTLIKYVPQAYMNYRRQNTVGWSIGNIFLDCTGGTLCMLQMILNAYNYADWVSLLGNPTKFGLGIFTITFDIFFMLQHYVFYRDAHTYK